jgi:energy-converting hydrogenase Eha subunit F
MMKVNHPNFTVFSDWYVVHLFHRVWCYITKKTLSPEILFFSWGYPIRWLEGIVVSGRRYADRNIMKAFSIWYSLVWLLSFFLPSCWYPNLMYIHTTQYADHQAILARSLLCTCNKGGCPSNFWTQEQAKVGRYIPWTPTIGNILGTKYASSISLVVISIIYHLACMQRSERIYCFSCLLF